MSAPAAKNPKRRAQLALRISLLFAFFAILFYWAQPFSKRFEGKTARDWFAVWTMTRQCRADVIDAFGAEVVPDLVGTVTTIQTVGRAWYRIFGSEPTWMNSFFRAGDRHQLAIDWLAILHHRGQAVLPELLAAGQTNVIGSVLSYHSLPELREMLANESNVVLRFQIERVQSQVTRSGPGDINRLLVSQTQMGEAEPRRRRRDAEMDPSTAR